MNEFDIIFDKNKRNKAQSEYTSTIDKKTMYYQRKYGFQINQNSKYRTWNNEGDAFKHTFGSADTALKEGSFVSWAKGIYHECQTPNNPESEKNMDNWNNNQGRLIAKEIKKEYKDKLKTMTEKEIDDIIAQKVMQRMRVGKLITSPSDKRKYTGFATNLPTDKIFIREDISKLSTDDFEELEDSINEQLSSFGIPTELQAQQAVQNGSLIWINSYKKEDGTQVCGYYRRK